MRQTLLFENLLKVFKKICHMYCKLTQIKIDFIY